MDILHLIQYHLFFVVGIFNYEIYSATSYISVLYDGNSNTKCSGDIIFTCTNCKFKVTYKTTKYNKKKFLTLDKP